MKTHYFGKRRLENGQLIPVTQVDKHHYDQFKNTLHDGDIIEVYCERQHDNGTLAQLAKIHAMIRELALHIGESFEDMKYMIKHKAGLCLMRTIAGEEFLICKSLGDCSKEELSMAIEAAKQIGEQVNHPLQ